MPKKPDNKASKKEKELKKIAVDSTFGMKNKNKSQAVQSIIKNIASQSKGGYEKLQQEIFKEKKVKEKVEEENRLMLDVFGKTVPKQVITSTGEEITICQFFKAGLCQKGKKCKYSHNVNPDPVKTEKMDLFTDQREQMFGRKDEIDNWDDEKLKEVVNFNEGKYNGPNRTDKTCKFFLEAVEKKTYGWMWTCPNGFNCIFRHCLPEGYVFKNAKKAEPEKQDQPDVFDQIDAQREKLDAQKLTPVTKEGFFKWLEKRTARKEVERQDKIKEELKKIGVKPKKKMTGKELFEKDKELFQDADDAVDEYEREEIIEEVKLGEDVEGKDNIEFDAGVFEDEEVPDL